MPFVYICDKIIAMDNLNEEQIKPVLDTEGPVLVLAGAGSGKTRVLTSRIAYILRENKATLSQILAITFTNKAAAEMNVRLEKMIGVSGSKWICTIHSMCVKILREFADKAGIKSNFSIYSETERGNVIKKAVQELEIDDEKFIKDAKYHIGNGKMLGLDPDQYGRRYQNERKIKNIVAVYELYNRHMRENNALDFDDLLLETLRLLKKDDETREYLSDKFKYILVDEFQDTNSVQYNIIRLLAAKHRNLFAVGDDDQSIYGWRGAEIENILKFDKDYPDAKIYKLERNYRSTKSILSLANCIIKNNTRRHAKQLWTQAEEGENPVYYQADEEAGEALFTARTINEAVINGGRYSDFAVLMRINALTRSYEQEFTKYGIPYKVFGGFKFYERREIKDILAYLRLISNPDDNEAMERIINVPKRGIGGKTVQTMYEYSQSLGFTLYDAVIDSDELPLSQGTKNKINAFAALIKDFVFLSLQLPVNELVRRIISVTNLRAEYDDGSDEGDGKLANLDEFIASVDDYVRLNPNSNLNDYLNQITLFSDTDEMDEGNYVTLATIHSVKGLEFPTVFICGLEDGIMPSTRSSEEGRDDEEERRLMYVAITRAKTRLYLTRSKSRYLYGRREMTVPSRFVKELRPILGNAVCSDGGYGGYSYRNQGRNFGGYGSEKSYREKSEGRALYSASDDNSYSNYSSNGFKASSTFGGAKKQTAATGKNYTVGMRVRHPKFGVGMVVAVKNGGSIINVAFDGQGVKELSAALAPLTVI